LSISVVVQDATTNPTTASHILEADMKHDEHIVSITVLKRVSFYLFLLYVYVSELYTKVISNL